MRRPADRRTPFALGHIACVVLTAAFGLAAQAAEPWPAKPVRIVAPFPAGGATDVVARLIANRFAESTGQQVIVENRPGGGGNVGAEIVSRAAPDGTTLLLGGANLVHNPIIRGDRVVHPMTGLAPVARVVVQPVVVSTGPKFPARTIGEVIALARREPGRVTYSTTGVGTTPHVAAVLLARQAGIDMLHVPYSGSAAPQKDVISGEVALSFSLPAVVAPLISQGQLVGLATTGDRRLGSLPTVPTIAEAGYPAVDIVSWYGLFAPPGTPPDTIARIEDETGRAIADTAVAARLEQLGAQPAFAGTTPFTALLRQEFARLTPIIQSLGIKAE